MEKETKKSPKLKVDSEKASSVEPIAKNPSKPEETPKKQEDIASWEDFEELTGGSFNKLLGCGG